MAFRVARLAQVWIDDLLDGKYPVKGMCPHCGRGPNWRLLRIPRYLSPNFDEGFPNPIKAVLFGIPTTRTFVKLHYATIDVNTVASIRRVHIGLSYNYTSFVRHFDIKNLFILMIVNSVGTLVWSLLVRSKRRRDEMTMFNLGNQVLPIIKNRRVNFQRSVLC